MREERGTPGRLLSADQVRKAIEANRSTVYRMVVTLCPWCTGHEAGPGLRPGFRPGLMGMRLVAVLVADGDEPRALYRLSTQERAGC